MAFWSGKPQSVLDYESKREEELRNRGGRPLSESERRDHSAGATTVWTGVGYLAGGELGAKVGASIGQYVGKKIADDEDKIIAEDPKK